MAEEQEEAYLRALRRLEAEKQEKKNQQGLMGCLLFVVIAFGLAMCVSNSDNDDTGTNDYLRLIDIETGEVEAQAQAHGAWFRLAQALDGTIFTASQDGAMSVWESNLRSRIATARFELRFVALTAIAGQTPGWAAYAGDGQILVLDSTLSVRARVRGPASPPTQRLDSAKPQLWASADGRMLVAFSGGAVGAWRLTQGRNSALLSSGAISADFRPDRNRLVYISTEGVCRAELPNAPRCAAQARPMSPSTLVRLSNSGDFVAVLRADQSFEIQDFQTGERVAQNSAAGLSAPDLSWFPSDGTILITGSRTVDRDFGTFGTSQVVSQAFGVPDFTSGPSYVSPLRGDVTALFAPQARRVVSYCRHATARRPMRTGGGKRPSAIAA